MSPRIRRWLWHFFGRDASIAIADCVHFGAWRYGRSEFNPYENYQVGLARGEARVGLRARFVEFLRHYRPRDFGAALGRSLQQTYPLWQYPWARQLAPPAWLEDPAECPDILTHFSPQGILRSRIEQELDWLEQTYESIRQHGYQSRWGGPIEARCLVAANGARRFLILDGNHRLGALAALGHRVLRVRWLPMATVRELDLPRWRGVKDGTWTPADAAQVFEAYFEGNRVSRTTETPATIIENQKEVPL